MLQHRITTHDPEIDTDQRPIRAHQHDVVRRLARGHLESTIGIRHRERMSRSYNVPAKARHVFTLHAAPALMEPKRGAVARAGMSFRWSPVPDASYALEFVPERESPSRHPKSPSSRDARTLSGPI